MKRTRFFVRNTKNGWAVYKGRALWNYYYKYKNAARIDAIAAAKSQQPSQVFVQDQDTMQYNEELTYPRSSDPRPKPGSKRNRG